MMVGLRIGVFIRVNPSNDRKIESSIKSSSFLGIVLSHGSYNSGVGGIYKKGSE